MLLALLISVCLSTVGPLALHFLGDNAKQYGISPGSPQELTSITACFWMSVPEKYVENRRTNFVSYASSKSANDFLLALRPKLDLLMKNKAYKYDLESLLSAPYY